MQLMKRSAPFVAGILLCMALLAQPSHAATSDARKALEETINKVLVELQKPELKNPATRNAVLDRVELIVRSLFSFEELSMRTVGPKWKSFSEDEKKRFIDAFEDLLRGRYLSNLEGYNGEVVTYTGEAPVGGGGDKVQIDTTVNIKNKPVPVSYRMINKGRWMVYDIIIEGVSMVQNYRSQFQSVLERGTPDQLIQQVRVKADETRATHNK